MTRAHEHNAAMRSALLRASLMRLLGDTCDPDARRSYHAGISTLERDRRPIVTLCEGVMKVATQWKDAREHAAFAGDGMLLVVPVAGILVAAGMNLLVSIGVGGAGFIVGAVVAVAATPIVVWLIHRRSATRVMWVDSALSALIVVVAGSGLYALVVLNELDQSRAFSIAVLVVLGIEATIAFGLLIDSTVDLARGREHTTLDVIRLAVLAVIAAVLALFSRNPDFGVVLAVLAPLCLAGALTAALGDGLLTFQERSSRHSRGGVPT